MQSLFVPHARAVLECPSGSCNPIPLPFATLPPTVKRPRWWPTETDWLYVACPDCKLVSAHVGYSVRHFGDSQSVPQADKSWLCISFRCAVESCDTPVQFHILREHIESLTTEHELREKLATGYWKGACQNGHSIATTSAQEIRFEWDRETLRGYDPNHPEWRDL